MLISQSSRLRIFVSYPSVPAIPPTCTPWPSSSRLQTSRLPLSVFFLHVLSCPTISLSPCLAMPCNLFIANRSCNFLNGIPLSDGVVDIDKGSHIPLCSFGTSAC
ncbi:hypothetical protein M438DRAFT_157542 [Aureobasidium pullulans EXF-150]|uniref:Uncharacterized protein n=1 Tax=Aureobasidium pullulans EXF-150 TaxID=1043002 RepID=A0A074XMT1_AURPU|nr:uncharacterized protein M438DRAFT_157542 [Aureobasidium pullulans EXF-150]KEQ86803.1 hypothetical protein M438DRAFT_157542 [Aureobasidium pullulans EXF-150]